MNQTCSRCKLELPATREYFAWRSDNGKLRGQCRRCLNHLHKPAEVRYRERLGAEFVARRRRAYYEREKSSGVHQRRSREYRVNNWERVREIEKRYQEPIRATPKGRITDNVRRAIRTSLERKHGQLNGRFVSALPYRIEHLVERLESLFRSGMSWANYGEWHIDHISPIASFDYSSVDDPEFQSCWALDNLQPLWASENLSKAATMPST